MELVPEIDTIYTEFHPSSGLAPNITPLEEHNRKSFPNLEPEQCPWEPFRTRIDFEALELVMEIGFNQKQLARYIEILHKVQNQGIDCIEQEKFMVRNAQEAMSLWDLAMHHHVEVSIYFFVCLLLAETREHDSLQQFTTTTISHQYGKEPEPREFEFRYQDPWEWALQIIKEPTLHNHIVWGPQKNYRWTGEAWKCFYDELWSGNSWWRAQVMSIYNNIFMHHSSTCNCYVHTEHASRSRTKGF
jgi:hypothetical protein